jgi:hypothetical protein
MPPEQGQGLADAIGKLFGFGAHGGLLDLNGGVICGCF